jgi:hypothetical protein
LRVRSILGALLLALLTTILAGPASTAAAAPAPPKTATTTVAPQKACHPSVCDPDPVSCMSWGSHVDIRRSAFYVGGSAHGHCAKNEKLRDYWMHFYIQGCRPVKHQVDPCGKVPGSYVITGASTAPHDVRAHARVECKLGTTYYFRVKSAMVSRNWSGVRKSWPWQNGPTSGNKRCGAPVYASPEVAAADGVGRAQLQKVGTKWTLRGDRGFFDLAA